MDKLHTRVYLDPEHMEWLKLEAKKQHSSMSQVIRSLIVEKTQKREPESK